MGFIDEADYDEYLANRRRKREEERQAAANPWPQVGVSPTMPSFGPGPAIPLPAGPMPGSGTVPSLWQAPNTSPVLPAAPPPSVPPESAYQRLEPPTIPDTWWPAARETPVASSLASSTRPYMPQPQGLGVSYPPPTQDISTSRMPVNPALAASLSALEASQRYVFDPISGLATEAVEAPIQAKFAREGKPVRPGLDVPAGSANPLEWWARRGEMIEARREAGKPYLPIGDVTPLLPSEFSAIGRGVKAGLRAIPTEARTAVEVANRALTSPALGRAIPVASVKSVTDAPQAAKRYYHGTGSAFDAPDAARFDPNGLYGPGYYMTDTPEVAGSYAASRTGTPYYARDVLDARRNALKIRQDQYETMTRLNPELLPEVRNDLLRSIEGAKADLSEAEAMFAGQGQNIRAISVPENLNLYPANEVPVTDEAVKRIAAALPQGQGQSFTIQAGNARWSSPSGVLSGEQAYEILADVANSKAGANAALREAGFDGLHYPGGRHMPLLDEQGQAIQHEALVIFPESLPKITNAISGTPMGSAPEVGGAIVGGLAYQDDPNLTPQENAQRRLAAAAVGGVAGRMLRRGRSPGATVEDVTQSRNAANRALGEMYAKGPSEAGKSPWSTLERGRRAVVRAFTDEGVDLNKFQQEAAKAKGAALTMEEMAAELRRLNPDKAAQVHLQEQLSPAIQSVGKDRSWLSVYLTHQDNIDVAKAMGNESRKFSGGLKAEDSVQALADMTSELGDERYEEIQKAAEAVWSLGRDLLARKREAGLISQEFYDDLVKQYPHYVPTRITDYLKDPMNIPRGKSLSVRDTGLRRNTIEGTFREREDPLASVVRNAYETEALARKNQAFNAFLKLREMNTEAQRLIRPVADSYTATRLEAKVTGFVDGKRMTYVVPKALEYIIKSEPNAVLPGFAGALWGGMMNLFRAGATSRNPAFLVGNAVLDAGAYAIRESSRAGGPQNLPKVLWELGKAYGDAFGGVLQGTYKGSTAEFLKGGGGMFGFFQGTPKSARATVETLGRRNVFTVDNLGDIRRLATDLVTLKPVEGIGERIELAPRVASFRLAQQRGANQVQAVINGRTVTIDFAQGGTVAKVINQFVPFFNVGVQASTISYRAFRENPRSFLATTAALLSGPTIAAEAWNRADPQRAKDYEDVPQYIKDQGIVIMLPIEAPLDEQGNRDPQFVHLRMREFAPFVTLTREAAQRALGDDPREWRNLIAGTLGAASPIQGNNPTDVLSSFTPLGVSTGLQVASNQDYFRGRMIATKRNDERASALSKAVASRLGVQPSQAEFVIRDLTTGVGGAALAASDLAAGIDKGDAPQDMPVVGGAYGRFIKGSTGNRLEKARQNLITSASSEALKAAGVELNLSPVQNTIDNVPLKLAEQERYQVLVNQYTEQAIQKALALRNWNKYDPDQRTEIVKDLIGWARDKAKAEVFKEMGSAEIKRRLAEAS